MKLEVFDMLRLDMVTFEYWQQQNLRVFRSDLKHIVVLFNK